MRGSGKLAVRRDVGPGFEKGFDVAHSEEGGG